MSELKEVGMLSKEHVNDWLDRYGKAWETGDHERVTSLFSEDAVYHEDPFEEPMRGHPAIRHYWKTGASDSQENVSFRYRVWAIDGTQCFAHWHATFTRITTQERVELDGVFRLQFQQSASGVPVCISLQEWWHRRQG